MLGLLETGGGVRVAKSEYMKRNEELGSYSERKNAHFCGSNHVTDDRGPRIPALKIILSQRIRIRAVSG